MPESNAVPKLMDHIVYLATRRNGHVRGKIQINPNPVPGQTPGRELCRCNDDEKLGKARIDLAITGSERTYNSKPGYIRIGHYRFSTCKGY
jgi:hypothetical protein